MLDPQLSLAISVHSNPGVYALLLGSGLSSSAGIPTGWGVILDLIQQVAALQGEEVTRRNAETWYREQFEKAPEYGEILDALAKSQAERQQLLRSYVEPNDEEREEGLKVPTEAHHAIAELVKKGALRVIVTTNFDRLMERALEEQGITPTVIASADAAQGALPLAHSPCTIIKLHGDYMDTRIRNTAGELESYPPELDRLLDQVLDEYGLIVCGWSADWDAALRSALERVKGHRFTTYWAAHGEPTQAAKDLIQLRRAVTVPIGGADSFFRDLAEKVTSLKELARPDPLSAAVAVQSLKRYLPNPLHRIRLHDLVMGEYGTLRALLTGGRRPDRNGAERTMLLTLRRIDVMEGGVGELLPGKKGMYLPLSMHIWDFLKPHLLPYTGDERRYEAAFHRHEYLFALVYHDVAQRENWYYTHIPVGRFALRARYQGTGFGEDMAAEVEAQGSEWPPLRAGLFRGDPDHFRTVKAESDPSIQGEIREIR